MKMKSLFLALSIFLAAPVWAQVPNTLTPAEKVYGLSQFWQEVNYNFVYFDRVDKDMWDNAYRELISSVQRTPNDYEYYRELQKFCALLKDGHTNVYMPDNIKERRWEFGDYLIELQNIEGKAVVARTNRSKKDEIPIGSEVIEVNGKEVKQYMAEKVVPYISQSTDYMLEDWSRTRLLMGVDGTSFDVKFRLPDGKIKQLKLTVAPVKEKEVYPEYDTDELVGFRWIDEDIAYVSLNSFDDEEVNEAFEEKLPELCKAKRLIIDLRNNTGGSSDVGLNVLKYLVNDDVLYGSKCTSRMYISAYRAWGTFLEAEDTLSGKFGRPKEEVAKYYLMARNDYYYTFPYTPDTVKVEGRRIVVPTVILIGHRTASAAEDFLIYADGQKHMTKIGEPTFGSTGQPLVFDLPGGGWARICTKKDTYPDGREFVGYGVKPDIEVKLTLSDYLDRRDPALEKAVEYLSE